jgi:hypothetical protein
MGMDRTNSSGKDYHSIPDIMNVILILCCCLPDDDVIFPLVCAHFRRLRTVPCLRKTTFLVGFESNMGWDRGSRYRKEFNNPVYQPLTMFEHRKSTKDQPKVGIFTTATLKQEGSAALKVSLQSGAICYSNVFQSEEPTKVRSQFHNQMRMYRDEIKEPLDPVFGKFKHEMGAKGPGGKRDDLVLAVQQNLRLKQEKCSDAEFVKNAADNGWVIQQ